MKTTSVTAGLIAAALSFAGTAQAADPARGELLYENHCSECHTTGIHFRERRKARNADDVRGWVVRWQQELKLEWSAAEVDDVSAHLNQRFYKFPDS